MSVYEELDARQAHIKGLWHELMRTPRESPRHRVLVEAIIEESAAYLAVVAAADYVLTRRIMDGSAPAGALNPMVPLELEHRLADAGLQHIDAGSVVAETHQYLPSLKVMLSRRVQQAVELGAVTAAAGAEWLQDLEARDTAGRFFWAALVRWAVGTKIG